MNRLYVPLSNAVWEQLIGLAVKERRHPSQQAAVLIEDALRRISEAESSNGREQEVPHVSE